MGLGKEPLSKKARQADCCYVLLNSSFFRADKTWVKLELFSAEVPLVCSANGGLDLRLSAD